METPTTPPTQSPLATTTLEPAHQIHQRIGAQTRLKLGQGPQRQLGCHRGSVDGDRDLSGQRVHHQVAATKVSAPAEANDSS